MNEKDLAAIIKEQQSNINASEKSRYVTSAMPTLMRKVYVWMTMALAITGLTAYYVAHSSFIITLYNTPALLWGLIIGELALVFIISGMINRLSLTTATLLFVLYSVINGITLSSIFMVYTTTSIAKVFFITAGTFGVMALIGYNTKKDLSSIGRLAFMALIGLIIATLVNVFFVKSTGFDLMLSYLGVLIFVGLTAYDTQKIKQMFLSVEYADESAQKIALLGALSLYLDFINLFLYLLRIFGSRD